jgi:hypothetical protein
MNWLTPDAATYISLCLGVVTLFLGGSKYLSKIKRNQKQCVKNGNALQAGRDLNINIKSSKTAADAMKVEEEHSKKSSDLRTIEKLLELIPYEDTIHHVSSSYLSGMPSEFACRLDRAESFNNIKHQLFNVNADAAKSAFIDSIIEFNDVSAKFLGFDGVRKEPLILTPPFHWKSNGSEAIYRDLQSRLSNAANSVTQQYDHFIAVLKTESFVSDKI